MSIQQNEITYIGNGETRVFYFTFAYFDTNDVKISIDGEIVTNDEYAIQETSAGSSADIPYDGGEITFITAPANNTEIKIWREIELTRSIDYQPTALIKAESLNQDFNFSLEVLKDFKEKLLTFSDQYADLLTLPSAAELFETINTLLTQIDEFGDLDTIVRDDDLSSAITELNATLATINQTLANKANCDADNFTDTGKTEIVSLGIPDYVNGVQKTWGVEYTATNNCFIVATQTRGGSQAFDDNAFLFVDDQAIGFGGGQSGSSYSTATANAFVAKGSKYIAQGDGYQTSLLIIEYPLKGEINA